MHPTQGEPTPPYPAAATHPAQPTQQPNPKPVADCEKPLYGRGWLRVFHRRYARPDHKTFHGPKRWPQESELHRSDLAVRPELPYESHQPSSKPKRDKWAYQNS